RAGAHEHLSLKWIVLCGAAPPRAAMHEDRNWRVRKTLWLVQQTSGAVNVEFLDIGFAIRLPLGHGNKFQRAGAERWPPPGYLGLVGRPLGLIVGVIERLLVHIAPDKGTIDALKRCGSHALELNNANNRSAPKY